MTDNRSPAIAANRDDSGYRRGSAKRGGNGGGGGGAGIGANIIMAILIAGLAVAGWFIFNQRAEIKQSELAMEDAQARLKVLEDRLRVTDQAMSETGSETQEKLGFWEDEIRKVWDVANKRNKNWIETNQKKVAKLEQSVTKMESSSRNLASSVSRHEEGFKRQQVVEDQITKANAQINKAINSQRDLVDQVNVAKQTVASLKSGLERRVAENEQAVRAIDAYRLQVNNRLVELERKANSPGL